MRKRRRARPPIGVGFMLTVLLGLLVLIPFRMPPMSQGASLTYYMANAEELEPMPDRIERMLSSGGYTLDINAPVSYPKGETISVYDGSPWIPDVQRLKSVLFPGLTELGQEPIRFTDSASRFDRTGTTTNFAEGYIEVLEAGNCIVEYFEPTLELHGVEDVRRLLKDMDCPVDDVAIQWDEESEIYTVTQMLDGALYSGFPAFDAMTGNPTNGLTFKIEMMDDAVAYMVGSFWIPGEILRENVPLFPLSKALDKLEAELFSNNKIDRIELKYHSRITPAQPFTRLIYPVWELTDSRIPDQFILLNAITGACEAMIMDDGGEMDDGEFSE